MPEAYELIPIEQLQKDDVVFTMGARRVVTSAPRSDPSVSTGWVRLPLAKLDGSEEMAPPYAKTDLIPARVRPSRSRPRTRAYTPDLSRQDDELIGTNLDEVLERVRWYVGAGELVPPDLVRKLDSALSRGFAIPIPWKKANYRSIRAWAERMHRDLVSSQHTAQRLLEEIDERMNPELTKKGAS